MKGDRRSSEEKMAETTEDFKLTLDPDEDIHFKFPVTNETTYTLKFTNDSDKDQCWKAISSDYSGLLQTAPNFGIIKPGETDSVTVSLSAMTEKPYQNHFISLVHMPVPEGNTKPGKDLWKDYDGSDPAQADIAVFFDDQPD